MGLVHSDDPERCYGEGGGRGVHVWERMYTHGGFMSINRETKETVTDFIFGDSKITAGGDCSHEIKTHLLLGRKAITKLDRVLKKQRYNFADKGPYSQSYSIYMDV